MGEEAAPTFLPRNTLSGPSVRRAYDVAALIHARDTVACTICVNAVTVERELSHPRHNMCHARAVPHSHTPARSVVCAVQYCRPGGTSPYPPPRAVSPSRFPGGVSTCRAPSSSRGGESVDMRVACAGGDISHTTTTCCLGYTAHPCSFHESQHPVPAANRCSEPDRVTHSQVESFHGRGPKRSEPGACGVKGGTFVRRAKTGGRRR